MDKNKLTGGGYDLAWGLRVIYSLLHYCREAPDDFISREQQCIGQVEQEQDWIHWLSSSLKIQSFTTDFHKSTWQPWKICEGDIKGSAAPAAVFFSPAETIMSSSCNNSTKLWLQTNHKQMQTLCLTKQLSADPVLTVTLRSNVSGIWDQFLRPENKNMAYILSERSSDSASAWTRVGESHKTRVEWS